MYGSKKTKCGVIGLFDNNNKKKLGLVLTSLKKLQHRGRESCGISWKNGDDKIKLTKTTGLVI